jgi:hypothetical protein
MNIRSVTAFADISHPLDPEAIARLGRVAHAVREALVGAGFTVQTTRLATQPFPAALGEAGPDKAVELAKDLAAVAFVHEIDYLSLGLARLDDPPAYSGAIPDILSATENVFASIEIANRHRGLSLPRIRRAAEVISRVATLSSDGLAGLRLGALANVEAWSPFFPAGYHGGSGPRIAIATESADLAVQAIGGAGSLAEARSLLVEVIEAEAARIESVTRGALDGSDVKFQGIDFSLAPFPEKTRSIGTALEKLGIPASGSQGTLMAAAFLTETLDRAKFARTGFCGLMLPVLEDTVLAEATGKGRLHVTDLLAFSAVCGTGLDTIPLPGDTSPGELGAILLDVAALALRLDKPLTARLVPLPGKQAGDSLVFDSPYFAPSRVMATQGGSLEGLLAGDEEIDIAPLGR